MVTGDLVTELRHRYAKESDAVAYFDRIGALAAGR
jgi:hypothetical protein